MRHRKAGRKLNRTSSHRKAMFSNMMTSLLEHEIIKTTVPKAKELRRYIEPVITMAKDDTVANRRQAFAKLRNKAAVAKLFTDIAPRFNTRPGGYTRVLKNGFRAGDNAPMAIIELVERGETQTAKSTKSAPKDKPATKAKPPTKAKPAEEAQAES